MAIPNADQAIIDPVKIHGYLLSRAHPIGRFKAPFFEGLGYSAKQWARLAEDLRVQHLSQEPIRGNPAAYGHKYEIRATLGMSRRLLNLGGRGGSGAQHTPRATMVRLAEMRGEGDTR